MRRNATPSSRGSGSGRGSRLHLTVLLATVAAFLLVPAAQAAAANLKVNIAGTGSGEVESEFSEFPGTPPIECSYSSPGPATGTCENEMSETLEDILAVHAAGSEFGGWKVEEGIPFPACSGGEEEKEIQEIAEEIYGGNYCRLGSEGGPAKITVYFCTAGSGGSCEEEPASPTALTVSKTGEGTIVSSPGGIICGGKCSHNYEKGSTVTLTASPAIGFAFNTWAGCTTHVGLTCTVEMSKAKTVKASFIATPSLSIEKTGSGAGKVGATGISCDENCSSASSAIKAGTTVTFKVSPAKGSEAAVFEGGTGSSSGCLGASCTFTISSNSTVKVKFNAIPTNNLTVDLTGPAAYKGKVTGKGTVKGLTGSAINCGSGCTTQTEAFFSTDSVTLTAVAGTGYSFAGWEGAEGGTCTGKTSPCTVPMSSAQTLSAKFE